MRPGDAKPQALQPRIENMKLFLLILKNLRRNLLRTTLTSVAIMVLVLVVTLVWTVLWFLENRCFRRLQ